MQHNQSFKEGALNLKTPFIHVKIIYLCQMIDQYQAAKP